MVKRSNHNQLRLVGQPKNAFPDEDMSKSILVFIKERLKDNRNVEIIENPTGLVYAQLATYTILGGHFETKNLGDSLKDFSKTYQVPLDYIISGHWHSLATGKRKIVIAYDPARSRDNSVILVCEIYSEKNQDGDLEYKMRLLNCINLIDISNKKKKKPMQTPAQIEYLKQVILDYNQGGDENYSNILGVYIDAGSGGGGVNIADYLMPDWKDKSGKTHTLERGMIIKADDNCIGKKRTLTTGCGTLHCEAFFDPETGQLLETYFSKGSSGGCQNFMIGLSRAISLAARGGIDIYSIVDQLASSGTCPSYAVRRATKHDTSKGSSCPVAIGNALIDMYNEMQNDLFDDGDGDEFIESTNKQINKAKCPQCGGELIFEGGCNTCKSCGWSKCD